MALDDKIEAVKKVSEALNDKKVNAYEEMERAGPGKEQFQTLVNTQTTSTQPSFQRVDTTNINQDAVQNIEQNPIIADNSVTVQGNGSATDQESKKRRQQATEDEAVVSSVKPGSLMDEVRTLNTQVSNVAKLSPTDIKDQAKSLIAQIDTIKTQLSQGGDIKSSYQTLLRNRLTHIDDNLKIALSKAGVEYTGPTVPSTNSGTLNPIQRFLGYLTHSQYQLDHLNQTIESLNMGKKELSPANMLALQIKVGYVQQQLELFTSLLNKALESTKTLMNVQV